MPSFFTRALSPRGDSFFPLRRTFKKVKIPSTTTISTQAPPTPPLSDDLLMSEVPLSPSPPTSTSSHNHGHGHGPGLNPNSTSSPLFTAAIESPSRDSAPLSHKSSSVNDNHKNVAFLQNQNNRPSANHARELDPEAEAVFFSGPPPPIVKTIYMRSPSASPSTSPTREGRTSAGNLAASLASLGSVFFDTGRTRKQPARYQRSPDSMWRRMQRHEKALAADLQAILDMQASAIAQGFTGGSRAASPASSFSGGSSDGGRDNDGTFYSARSSSSKSKMTKSLYQANLQAKDGTVLPVNQPKSPKKLGLRAARKALARSLAELEDLKYHEQRHIKAEIRTRNRALSRAERLAARRLQIRNELQTLETDDEEELARELRGLHQEKDETTREIEELEKKLVLLRKKERALTDKITHVASKREAGLSGYRGALKEVNEEIAGLINAPPVEPLQTEAYNDLLSQVLDDDGQPLTAPGGPEFLSLPADRRTIDMAKSWWEAEIKLLEHKAGAVKKERTALEEGSRVWADTTRLISEYESALSRQMKALAAGGQLAEREGDEEEMVEKLRVQMVGVIEVLRGNLKKAEGKGWNLLICAIGAELAAFEEAEGLLRFGVPGRREMREEERAEAEDLLMKSLEGHIAAAEAGRGGDGDYDHDHAASDDEDSKKMHQRQQGHEDDEEDDEVSDSKFRAKRVVGPGSPVPKTFAQSSESLPSPAFKPYRDAEGEYSDNEVPDDLLLDEA